MAWRAIRPSACAFRSSGRASHAARMSANSVWPPTGGIARMKSRGALAGTSLKELSVCQSWLPVWKARRRLSALQIAPSGSRFETSAISVSTRGLTPSRSTIIDGSIGPKRRANSTCCSWVIRGSGKISTA